ncbi:MAG: phage tail sheath protein [Firmicutes bacterium]|nr:phage tail sheath protein [Bacillota bacterium]
MGLPKILIEFKTLAETIIKRSERGIVAVILRDNSNVKTSYTFLNESEIVKSHFTANNLSYLHLAFLGSPQKVIVERIGTEDTLDAVLERLKVKRWNYLTMPDATQNEMAELSDFVKTERDTFHKTFKLVGANISANHEGVINFTTEDIKVENKTYTAEGFCPRIAGILAGLPVNRSATYYVLDEVETIAESTTPDADIDSGKLILVNDGTKIKIGRGVNSLTAVTDEKGEDFKKIKIVEAIDIIRDDISSTFENDFVGKIENSYDNKVLFVAAVNKYFKELVSQGVLYDKFDNRVEIDIEANRAWLSERKDISDWDDEQIKNANTGTNVFVRANIQVQDAIEDLNFKVFME